MVVVLIYVSIFACAFAFACAILLCIACSGQSGVVWQTTDTTDTMTVERLEEHLLPPPSYEEALANREALASAAIGVY
jgi:hypothetical protein